MCSCTPELFHAYNFYAQSGADKKYLLCHNDVPCAFKCNHLSYFSGQTFLCFSQIKLVEECYGCIRVRIIFLIHAILNDLYNTAKSMIVLLQI